MEVSGRKQVGSDELRTGFLCDPCKGEDEMENAVFYCTVCNEFLCNTCAKAHRKNKMSKHHQLLDRDSMPKQKLTSSKESMCSKHNKKFVEYYCKIHDDCCCSVCATIEHKQCKVEYIDDIAIEYETSKEYTSLMSAIADLTQLLQNTKIIALKKKDDVGNIHMMFVSEVKKFRSEINHILDSLEQSLLIKAHTVRDPDTASTESASTTCDAMITDLAEMSSNMEKQKKYKQKRQLVISAKKAQNQIKQFESLTTKLDNQCTIRDYTFRPNEAIIQSLKAVNSFGNLEHDMKKEGSININNSYWIKGGVMLDNNMLALTNYSSSSVMSFDVINNKVISCIKLPIRPWAITGVERDQIVVTCDNKLFFIKVGEILSVMKDVDIGGHSRGIVYTNNTFICSFIDPGCIKIIDLGGKILKTLTTDIRGQTLFESPCYVALSTDHDTLYVADDSNGSVTRMYLDGNVQHVYKHDIYGLFGWRG